MTRWANPVIRRPPRLGTDLSIPPSARYYAGEAFASICDQGHHLALARASRAPLRMATYTHSKTWVGAPSCRPEERQSRLKSRSTRTALITGLPISSHRRIGGPDQVGHGVLHGTSSRCSTLPRNGENVSR